MKSDDIAISSIPEIKTISPLSTPRGTKIIFLNIKFLYCAFYIFL